MARIASYYLFLLFISIVTDCTSGTLVGISYNARGNAKPSSLSRALSCVESSKVSSVSRIQILAADDEILSSLYNSSVPVDLQLDDESLIENLMVSRPSAISWLKSHVVVFLPQVNIKSITVNGSNLDLPKVLATLKSIKSALGSFHLKGKEVKVSVQFSSSFLQNLSRKQEQYLRRILEFIRSTKSFVTVETGADTEIKANILGDVFLQSVIQKASIATSLLPCNGVPIVVKFKSLIVPTTNETLLFRDKVAKLVLDNPQVLSQVPELYTEVTCLNDFSQKELQREHKLIFPISGRELLNAVKTSLDDSITPPTTVYPTPAIVTVPATNPVTVTPTPTNPATTPVSIPVTTPVTVPSTTPVTNPSVTPAVPITNPVTTPSSGAQTPVTNPVTTYPAPAAGYVPITATPPPVFTSPVVAPPATSAPAIPGQSWCVARTGVTQTDLQAALDYACGIGGADCSQIQLGANCYNPNTLQNHASYAFNSYYQKNPVASSCDFGGTAIIVSANPSTGSCVFPTLASSPSVPTPSTTTTNPATPTTTSPATGATSYGTPPSVLNSSTNPATGTTNQVYGSQTPPGISSTLPSKAATLKPFIGSVILVTSFVTKTTILGL